MPVVVSLPTVPPKCSSIVLSLKFSRLTKRSLTPAFSWALIAWSSSFEHSVNISLTPFSLKQKISKPLVVKREKGDYLKFPLKVPYNRILPLLQPSLTLGVYTITVKVVRLEKLGPKLLFCHIVWNIFCMLAFNCGIRLKTYSIK